MASEHAARLSASASRRAFHHADSVSESPPIGIGTKKDGAAFAAPSATWAPCARTRFRVHPLELLFHARKRVLPRFPNRGCRSVVEATVQDAAIVAADFTLSRICCKAVNTRGT